MKYLILVLFIIVASAVYLYNSQNNYPNSDERSSILIALGKYQSLTDSAGKFVSLEDYERRLDYTKYTGTKVELNSVFQNVINDNTNAYLYYLVLAIIIKFIGVKIVWLRAFSVLLAALNLYLIYIIAGKFKDTLLMQWIALILAAINPVFSEDAVLIRSYMLMLTGCLLSILFLIRIIDASRKTNNNVIVFYFLSVLLAAGSHYSCFPLLIAEFCFIYYKYKKMPNTLVQFGLGYFVLLLIAIGWAYLIYPLGWRNLKGLNIAILKLAEQTPAYLFSLKNLAREWLNVATYFVGFSTQNLIKSRVFLKIFAFLFLVWMFVKLCRIKQSGNHQILIFILILTIFFFTMQSVFTHQLFNFIPHYIIWLLPLFIWGIALSLTELSLKKIK